MNMKKIMTILLAVMAIALTAQAQLVQPVKWAGAVEGDSIHLTATIENGWHLNIIELGDGFYMDEYEGTSPRQLPWLTLFAYATTHATTRCAPHPRHGSL